MYAANSVDAPIVITNSIPWADTTGVGIKIFRNDENTLLMEFNFSGAQLATIQNQQLLLGRKYPDDGSNFIQRIFNNEEANFNGIIKARTRNIHGWGPWGSCVVNIGDNYHPPIPIPSAPSITTDQVTAGGWMFWYHDVFARAEVTRTDITGVEWLLVRNDGMYGGYGEVISSGNTIAFDEVGRLVWSTGGIFTFGQMLIKCKIHYNNGATEWGVFSFRVQEIL